MLIKMLATAAGPDAVYRAGEVVDINTDQAKVYIAGGYAVAVDPKAVDVVEAAALEPPEAAVLPAAKKRR